MVTGTQFLPCEAPVKREFPPFTWDAREWELGKGLAWEESDAAGRNVDATKTGTNFNRAFPPSHRAALSPRSAIERA